MKRTISILIAVLFLISAFPLSVFADDYLPVAPPPPPQEDWGPPPTAEDYYVDPEPVDTKALSNDLMHGVFGADKDEKDEVIFPVPEDSWDGEYTDFSGKDGTTTRVFDNGSVYTTYPDGSKEGVDYKGNRYTRDKDGKSVTYGTDGNQYIKNADGSEEAIEANGTHIYMNNDGSSRSVTKDGFVFSRNTDGDIVSISVDGGETLNLKDENGDYITGEHTITGPNGKSFTLSNKRNDEGELSQFKIWFVSDGVGSGLCFQDNDNGTSFKILRDDGTGIEATETEEEKDDGSIIGKFTIISNNDDGSITNFNGTSVTGKDGNTQVSYDLDDSQDGKILSFKFTEDKDGNTIAVDGTMKGDDGNTITMQLNENEINVSNTDGKFLKCNPKTGSQEFFDPKTGDHIKINDEGEVEIFHLTDKEGASIDFVDGKWLVKDSYGKSQEFTIEKNKTTGETTITTADGDVYVIGKDGTVKKNGEEIRSFENNPTESKTDETKPDDGKFKTKDNTFFGVTLPIPDIGTVTEFDTEVNSWGEEVTTIRIDGLSYEQYIEYCKTLEALPGWEVYKGSFPEDVAHFPEDYNSKSTIDFTGNYKSLPHVTVKYYSDKMCESNGYPHFCMFVFRNFD